MLSLQFIMNAAIANICCYGSRVKKEVVSLSHERVVVNSLTLLYYSLYFNEILLYQICYLFQLPVLWYIYFQASFTVPELN